MSSIAIELLRRDGGTQPRAAIHPDWVEEYARDMATGDEFPPVVVFYDGENWWLADGFHRVVAAEALGVADVSADVRQGTRRDAILFSVSANSTHGMRRTNEDKRRAVLTLLNDQEWSGWSDSEIARRCAVDHKTVAAHRPRSSWEIPKIEQPRTVSRGGSTYAMDTGAIGRSYEPRRVDDVAAAPAASPDPEQQADFRLASAFGGRMRDMDPLMAESQAQLLKALRSRWGIRPAGLAHARQVHAWLGEIIEALEVSSVNAA